MSIRKSLDAVVRDLYPGYFALVMATGIVSIAAQFHHLAGIAWALFSLSLAAYAILGLLTALRVIRYFPRVARELTRHVPGPGFFTTVAGTGILGSQWVILSGDWAVGLGFWIFGILLWLLLIYTFFTAVMVHEPKPTLEDGLHGGWLVTVVATQSISVLGTLLAPRLATGDGRFLFVTLALYLLGCALYLLIISLIFYRLLFFTLTPQEFTPPYWINMGAIAITTLAGSLLIVAAPRWRFLVQLLPFLKGFTLFFWAAGTWWIPLLALLEIWRHLYRRFPIRYTPDYWDIVFPLGMYSACTEELARALRLPFLLPVSRAVLYPALLLWLVVAIGLGRRLARALRTAARGYDKGDGPIPT